MGIVIFWHCVRYPEAIPLKSTEAVQVAEALVAVFCHVGEPREILTDQGANFMSNLLTEVYKLLHVKRIRTSPYHPQTDDLVERFNQTLKAMIHKVGKRDGKYWDRLLPYLLFAYREVPQASTGFSLFELLYGRDVWGPLDVLKESWESESKEGENVLSYVLLMRERLGAMTELVQTKLGEAHKSQKQWYDRTAWSQQFTVGDEVLVLLPTSTKQLLAQWQRPYQVTCRVGKVNYEVDMEDKNK